MDANTVIRKMFRVKARDSLPFTGWALVTRDDLPVLFRELGYVCGAEIGVAQGTFSRALCEGIPNLKLFCVDPYQPYERISERLCKKRMAIAKRRLGAFDIEFLYMTSLEASKQIPDGSLDFVYIDGAHDFDNAMLDLILWSPKVRSGGIVSGHDYYEFYRAGVIRAVQAYTVAHNIQQWYLTRDRTPSYLWVQE